MPTEAIWRTNRVSVYQDHKKQKARKEEQKQMKYIKRTLALLLAVVLVLALSISAFAVDTNGSIKVDNAVVNKTYTLYRIFDLDSHNTDYSAINYKVSAKWANFFVTGAEGLNYVTIDDMGYVTWKDGANAADFAAAAIAYAKANGIANDGQQKATSSIVEFTNLPLGYYLVQSDLGALCSLDTTMPNVTIKEKNGEPTVDKEVEENGVYGKRLSFARIFPNSTSATPSILRPPSPLRTATRSPISCTIR